MISRMTVRTTGSATDRRWPFKLEDTVPLAWWRSLPSDAFRDAEHLALSATLERISVLHGDDKFAVALEGDAAAAIAVALSLMPIERITLQTDIAMSALLRCALDRSAAAALVLSQILGLTDLGHGLSIELAASWFAHGRRNAADPRKFSQAETALVAAFRARRRDGAHA